MEKNELRRNAATEADDRHAAFLRGRGASPRAVDGKGRSEESTARRESMRQVKSKASMM